MTNPEAKAIIEANAVPIFPLQIVYQDWLTAIHMAEEALDKRIPMKPIYTNERTVTRCPICKAIHLRCMPSVEVDYCSRCGQALDWSET